MLNLSSIQLIRWCALIFGILFLVLSFYNIPAKDDYHFLHNLHQYGIWNGMIHEYNTWSPRFASVLITHLFLWLEENWANGYFLFGLFSLLLVTLSVFSFLRVMDSLLTNNFYESFKVQKTIDQVSISLFVSSIWFLGSFRIGKTWFWLCSASTYLWSNAFFILLISLILRQRVSLFDYMLIFLCGFYIGGSCGPLSLTTVLLLLIMLILIYVLRIENERKRQLNRKILLSICALGLFFFLQYIAPGNRIRESFFREISIIESIILNVKMTGIIVLKRLPLSLLIDLILTFPIALMIQPSSIANYVNWMRNVLISTIIFGFLIFIFQWSITFKTQDVGAYRTLFFIQTLSLFFSGTFWILTAKYGILERLKSSLEKMKTGLLYAYVLTLLFLLYHQFIITRKYHAATTDRNAYVRTHHQKEALIELNPLPPSGMLCSAELSTDTAFFSNVHYKQGLQLKCKVRRKIYFPE
jgi:hypothetical protein